MADPERELERRGAHPVTPLELFFDLVLVFAFTQVTRLLTADPTWGGLLRGMLVLAALWFGGMCLLRFVKPDIPSESLSGPRPP